MDVIGSYLRVIDERVGCCSSLCTARSAHVGLVREEPSVLAIAPRAKPMPRQYARSALIAAKQTVMRGPAGPRRRQAIGACSATSDARSARGSHQMLGRVSSGIDASESNAMGGWRWSLRRL